MVSGLKNASVELIVIAALPCILVVLAIILQGWLIYTVCKWLWKNKWSWL